MRTKFLIFAVIQFICINSFAQKNQKQLKEKIIDANIGISKRIEGVAKGIDEGLAGGATDKPNNTQFVLRNQLIWTEGGNFLYKPHFEFKLHFPNIEEKLRLQFSTADDTQETRGINKTRVKTEPTRSSYGAGIGFFKKLGDISAEFEPRVAYQDRVLLSYILKFKSSAETSKKTIIVRPELQFFARSDTGLGEFLSLNTDILIYKSAILTIVNEEQYVDMENMFSTNHGLALSFDYSEKVSQSLSYIFESKSRPNFNLDRYTVAMGVTHKLLQNIVHYTVMPFLAFPRNLDFKGSPGISFELAFIF